MSHLAEEIRSQPAAWRRVPEVVADHGHGLPPPGGRVAVIGCGTSWFMASAHAGARETLGLGETDASAASEMPAGREYDGIVCITRSGTTTEVLTLLERRRAGVGPAAPTVAITTDPDAPVARDVGGATVKAGFVDGEAGRAVYSAAIGWRDVPLRDLLAARVGSPVALTHDPRAAGAAECRLGATRGVRDVLFVAIGTGVRAAVFHDGNPRPGAHGSAGELRHRVVRPHGPESRAGDRLLAPLQDAMADGDGPWPAARLAITELGAGAACLGAGLTAWDAGGER